MALNREQILALQDLKIKLIDVPGWGEVYIRQASAKSQEMLESTLKDDKGNFNIKGMRARVCAAAICDEGGVLQFSPEDIELLSDKSVVALNFINDEISKLNAITEEELEELAKNLSPDQ